MCFSSENLGFGELYIVMTCNCIYAGSFAGIEVQQFGEIRQCFEAAPLEGSG